MTTDFWDEIREIESRPRKERAIELRTAMLAAPWESVSYRDRAEFFNELLHSEELFLGLLADEPVHVLAKIASDCRQGPRQDQISKAVLLEKVSNVASVPLLLTLVRGETQDLDTRNTAIREAWRRHDALDEEVVPALRQFVRELLCLARQAEEPTRPSLSA